MGGCTKRKSPGGTGLDDDSICIHVKHLTVERRFLQGAIKVAGTLKIKVALAVNPKGEWVAYGYKGMIVWEDAMDSFDPLDNECRFFIEAEVPLPDEIAGTIKGEVIPA